MYVCGTSLVMLASPPGVSGSSTTRSLFGGTSGLSSLKSKSRHVHLHWESLLCFSVSFLSTVSGMFVDCFPLFL